MRRWLIDIPAAIVTLWFLAYRWLMIVTTMITVSTVIVMLLLAAFGIRWGW